MRVLLTGYHGYIGSILAPMLARHGHQVIGLDSLLFEGCDFGDDEQVIPSIRRDIRDLTAGDLLGFDAVLHLAGLSNDPLGDLNPDCTYDINHSASVVLAGLAKLAGVSRFIHSSSCSLYGSAGDDFVDEDAEMHPVTPYGASKAWVERDVSMLADESFSPVFLRNATAYGVSPRLRADLVVNNLVGYAMTTGEVLMKSDGSPWRPLVHVEDIARAFVCALEAPREVVHNEAFNVGATEENYTIREVAEIVEAVVPGSRVRFAEGAGPDKRCYRVDCSKIQRYMPTYKTEWSVERGVKELYAAYQANALTLEAFESSRYLRIRRVRELLDSQQIDRELRWI